MAKEKNLTSITTVAAADFARIVTSAGASVKATAANLAKYIVETYNGSTVAGSAQSVKSALDSLNSNSMTVKSILSSSDDLNDLTNGVYIWATARPQNIPVSENYGLVIVFEGNQGGTYYNFQFCSLSSRRLYYRRKQGDASGSFAAWSLVTATQV